MRRLGGARQIQLDFLVREVGLTAELQHHGSGRAARAWLALEPRK
jgi:hypothetical protein